MKKTKPGLPPPPSHIGMRELEDMFSEAGLPLPTIEYKVAEHGAYRYLLKWTGRFLEQAVSPPGTTCTLPFVATQSVRMTGNVLAWLRRKGFSLSEVIPDSTLGHLASYFLMSPKVVAEACAEAGYKDARPDTRIAELSDEVRRKLPAIAKRLSDETRPRNKALLDEQGRTTPMASQKSHHAALPAPAQTQDLRDQDRRRWVDVVGANGYFRPSGGPESVRHDLAKDDPRGWSSDKRRHAKRLSARAAANEATSTHKLVSPTQATPAANKISAAGEPAPTDDTIQKLYYALQRETNKHLNLECRATSDGGFWVTAHLGSQKIGAASGKSESIARRTVCQNILGAIQVVGIHSWLETLNQEGAESWQTALDSSLREMPDVVQKLDKPVGLDLEAAGVEAYEVGPNGEKAINAPLHLPGTITNDQILMGGTSLAPFSSVADTPSMTTSRAFIRGRLLPVMRDLNLPCSERQGQIFHSAMLGCPWLLLPEVSWAAAYQRAFGPKCQLRVIPVEPGWLSFNDVWCSGLDKAWQCARERTDSLHLVFLQDLNLSLPQIWARPLQNFRAGLTDTVHVEARPGWPENLRLLWSSNTSDVALPVPSTIYFSCGAVKAMEGNPAPQEDPLPLGEHFGFATWSAFCAEVAIPGAGSASKLGLFADCAELDMRRISGAALEAGLTESESEVCARLVRLNWQTVSSASGPDTGAVTDVTVRHIHMTERVFETPETDAEKPDAPIKSVATPDSIELAENPGTSNQYGVSFDVVQQAIEGKNASMHSNTLVTTTLNTDRANTAVDLGAEIWVAAAQAQANPAPLVTSRQVFHDVFGQGEVLREDGEVFTVRFNKFGVKKLSARFLKCRPGTEVEVDGKIVKAPGHTLDAKQQASGPSAAQALDDVERELNSLNFSDKNVFHLLKICLKRALAPSQYRILLQELKCRSLSDVEGDPRYSKIIRAAKWGTACILA